jgi:pimeloyl-ACP methyl ester carboxylesterase
MDQDWILVPMDTTDFSFMEDQGLQHQVDNVLYGVQIARYTRLFTGNGYGKVNLLGYSSGAATVYAAANQEAVLPPGLRHVGGLIPVDLPYKLAPEYEPGRQAACACVNDYVALIDSGVYADTGGILFVTLGDLALNDPAGDSPVLPGLTNRQAAIFFGGAIYNFFPLTDWWHYWGGVLVFDDLGLPVDFEFTPTQAAFEFLLTASPYEPGKFILDYCEVLCDETDVPFDDNLGEVTIPVLYIGGAGGLGKSGFYATTLLGSEDITLLNPALRDPADIAYDIGHIDIWTADDAPSLFWGPLLDWIDDHTPGN